VEFAMKIRKHDAKGFFLVGHEKTTEKVKNHCLSIEQPNKMPS
jgi:hypothetical protein